MRFSTDSPSFVDALTQVTSVIGGNPTLPILYGVRIEVEKDSVHLTATDLETTVQRRVTANTKGDGVVILPGRLLLDMLKKQPAVLDLTIDVGPHKATITAGTFKAELPTLPAADYPTFDAPETFQVSLDADAFAEAVAQITPAAHSDRAGINGVRLEVGPESVNLIATDSYRLAVTSVSRLESGEAEDEGKTVPVKSLQAVAKTAEGQVDIAVEKDRVAFSCGDAVVTTRLIDADFPNWQQFIPADTPVVVTVDREPLARALDAVASVGRGIKNAVQKWDVQRSKVSLESDVQDVGSAQQSVECSTEGDRVKVGINPKMMLEALKAFGTDVVTIGVQDAFKPLLLTAEDSALRYVIMPVRLA